MVKGAATLFRAAGQTIMIRPYRKKKMKNTEWKIRFDVISEDGQDYVESCYAYASTGLTLGELHSQNGYRVRFNDNPETSPNRGASRRSSATETTRKQRV